MRFQIQEIEDYLAADFADDEVSAALGVEALVVDVVAVQSEAAACLRQTREVDVQSVLAGRVLREFDVDLSVHLAQHSLLLELLVCSSFVQTSRFSSVKFEKDWLQWLSVEDILDFIDECADLAEVFLLECSYLSEQMANSSDLLTFQHSAEFSQPFNLHQIFLVMLDQGHTQQNSIEMEEFWLLQKRIPKLNQRR